MISLYLFVRFFVLLQSLTFGSHAVVRADPKVDQCLSRGVASQIVNCLIPFTVPENTWTTDEEFLPAQLSPQEFADYLRVVHDAFNATEGGAPCTSQASPYTLPESLRNFVVLRQIGDLCLLAESTLFNGTRFDKGLPLIALRSRLTSSRPIHISAPHPQVDGRVHLQAAVVFEHTGARSFLAATRHRAAYAKQGCGKLSQNQPVVPGWVTDGAHHDQEVFHQIALALSAWQQGHGGCPSSSCAYLQFFANADSSCSTVFISAGVATATWYTNSSAAQRANRFTQTLRTITSGVGLDWTLTTPETPSNCTLTATSNLLGRVLNGVPIGQECDHTTTMALASGSFLSVQENVQARGAAQDQVVWARAVREAFAPACVNGYKLDGDAVGCAPVSR